MKYYAFKYHSGRSTTTGQPNERTGKMSIAGQLSVFTTKQHRDEWVDAGNYAYDMQGNGREAVTVTEARNLHLGMSVAHYNEMIEFITDITGD